MAEGKERNDRMQQVESDGWKARDERMANGIRGPASEESRILDVRQDSMTRGASGRRTSVQRNCGGSCRLEFCFLHERERGGEENGQRERERVMICKEN